MRRFRRIVLWETTA